MTFKSKQKGSRFEREVSKLIGQWFYNDPSKVLRTPTSGANLYKADIIANLEGNGDFFQKTRPVREKMPGGMEGGVFPFMIECKNCQIVDIDTFMFESKKGFLNRVWDKLLKEAHHNKSIPILICKKNRSVIWIIMEWDYYLYLEANPKNYFDLTHCCFQKKNKNLILTDFKKLVDYQPGGTLL